MIPLYSLQTFPLPLVLAPRVLWLNPTHLSLQLLHFIQVLLALLPTASQLLSSEMLPEGTLDDNGGFVLGGWGWGEES